MSELSDTPTHLVDELDKSALFGLALERNDSDSARRAYELPTQRELSDLFPELEIQELIGTGGMGCVFKVHQNKLDRTIALKILPKELASDSLFAERFSREARAMARLNHPNVIRVYDYGRAGDVCYLMMEHMDGMNLRDLLDAGQLSADESLRIFDQVCEGLAFAHREGVIHRDIKPENILFSRQGHVSIADFGLARLAMDSHCEVSLTQTRQAMGTLNYMAPEQWENPKGVDHRADVYALGILLYELLTGRVPRGSFPPASSFAAVPQDVDNVIHRALQVSPDERFADVGEMRTALAAAVSGERNWEQPVNGGTFTNLVNLGARFIHRTPKSKAAAASGKKERSPRTVVAFLIAVAVFMLSLMPWFSYQGRYWIGMETSAHVDHVEIPNALPSVAIAIVFLLIRFSDRIYSLRAYFVSLVLCGLTLGQLGMVISGELVLSGNELSYRDAQLTIVPFIMIGLIALLTFECLLRFVQELFTPLIEWCRHDEEVRRERWSNRWEEIKKAVQELKQRHDKK
jgi:serine/threonine protein kinase